MKIEKAMLASLEQDHILDAAKSQWEDPHDDLAMDEDTILEGVWMKLRLQPVNTKASKRIFSQTHNTKLVKACTERRLGQKNTHRYVTLY